MMRRSANPVIKSRWQLSFYITIIFLCSLLLSLLLFAKRDNWIIITMRNVISTGLGERWQWLREADDVSHWHGHI